MRRPLRHWRRLIERLVCADGGNADQTTTSGKDPLRAKQL
jgi:hypothetical protein